jgi:DNA-binding NarL/FixJ family response regulator
MTVSVLVVDDEAVIRDGLALIVDVEPSLVLAGTATDGQAAADMCVSHSPQVVLMDLHMPGWDGVRATKHITDTYAGTKVIALTTFDAEDMVWEALRAGACGYLLKDTTRPRLVAAIHAAAQGEAPLSPSLLARMAERFISAPKPTADNIPPALTKLSERELQVLRLVATGASNAQIAERLYIGQATVKTHLANVLMKLDIPDRIQAVIIAYETGLIRPSAGESVQDT